MNIEYNQIFRDSSDQTHDHQTPRHAHINKLENRRRVHHSNTIVFVSVHV